MVIFQSLSPSRGDNPSFSLLSSSSSLLPRRRRRHGEGNTNIVIITLVQHPPSPPPQLNHHLSTFPCQLPRTLGSYALDPRWKSSQIFVRVVCQHQQLKVNVSIPPSFHLAFKSSSWHSEECEEVKKQQEPTNYHQLEANDEPKWRFLLSI